MEKVPCDTHKNLTAIWEHERTCFYHPLHLQTLRTRVVSAVYIQVVSLIHQHSNSWFLTTKLAYFTNFIYLAKVNKNTYRVKDINIRLWEMGEESWKLSINFSSPKKKRLFIKKWLSQSLWQLNWKCGRSLGQVNRSVRSLYEKGLRESRNTGNTSKHN